MNLSKTDYRNTNQKDTNKDTKKFLIALVIYIVAIIFTDTMITNKTYAPAHLQNDKEQGQTYHAGELRMLDRPIQSSEPVGQIELSRGEAVRGRELTVQATSYSHTGRKTFSGTWPREGATIAVDNQKIKIGSRVYIYELNNWYLAEDKIPPESVRKGAVIDIFRGDVKSCWEWGRRDVRVRVVPPEKVANGKVKEGSRGKVNLGNN